MICLIAISHGLEEEDLLIANPNHGIIIDENDHADIEDVPDSEAEPDKKS